MKARNTIKRIAILLTILLPAIAFAESDLSGEYTNYHHGLNHSSSAVKSKVNGFEVAVFVGYSPFSEMVISKNSEGYTVKAEMNFSKIAGQPVKIEVKPTRIPGIYKGEGTVKTSVWGRGFEKDCLTKVLSFELHESANDPDYLFVRGYFPKGNYGNAYWTGNGFECMDSPTLEMMPQLLHIGSLVDRPPAVAPFRKTK